MQYMETLLQRFCLVIPKSTFHKQVNCLSSLIKHLKILFVSMHIMMVKTGISGLSPCYLQYNWNHKPLGGSYLFKVLDVICKNCKAGASQNKNEIQYMLDHDRVHKLG